MGTNILNKPIDYSFSNTRKIDPTLAEQSLYESYFGLEEKPFKLTPDPKYFFLSKQHQEALAHLIFGIQENKGFVVITGEVGTGKTTLCRSFLKQLECNIKVAYIFNPCLTDIELLQNINDELGIGSDSKSKKYLIDKLNEFLLVEKEQDNKVILIIDEAQNLAPDVLEQLRLISNLETDKDKLIQIVLIGQPEFDKILSRQDLRQLKQRITIDWELLPLNKEETLSYIKHRIKIAGGYGKLTFSNKAAYKIYQYSLGIPRMINVLADRALIIAFALGKKQISLRIIKYAIKDLEKKRYQSPFRHRLLKVTVITGFMLLMLFLFRDLISDNQKKIGPVTTGTNVIQDNILAINTDSNFQYDSILNTREKFGNFLKKAADYGRSNAIAEILNVWDMPPLLPDELSQAKFFHLEEKRGLSFFESNTTLQRLKLFNYPAILIFQSTLSPKPSFLLLVEIKSDYLTFLFDQEKIQVSTSLINSVWTGDAFVFWKNFEQINQSLKLGYQGPEVIWLSKKLKELGYYENNETDVFDNDLKKAVIRFQKENQLIADGIIGKETKIIIYNQTGDYKTPRLIYG